MFNVNVKRYDDKLIGWFKKETMDEVNSYLALIAAKPRPWHVKPDRWVAEDQREPYEVELTPIETRQVEYGEVTITEYHYAADYKVEIEDITDQVAKQVEIDAKIAQGKNERLCCEEVIDFIAGHFTSIELTEQQISQMLITFADVDTALKGFRAYLSKALIVALEVDTLVTQTLKDDINSIYNKYGI